MRFIKCIILGAAIAVSSVHAQSDTSFTYQGELKESGAPANGMYNMDFMLFDALAGGSQVGSTATFISESVADGLFNVELDFGAQDFSGEQYWLEIIIDGNTLSPREAMTASPYSIQTRGIFVDENNNVGIGTSTPSYPLHVVSDAHYAINALNTNIHGQHYGGRFEVISTDNFATGVLGRASGSTGYTKGVQGENFSTSGIGVSGLASASTGTTNGVFGQSRSSDGRGVYGEATSITGTTYGVYGLSESTDGHGVYGEASASTGYNYGVYGENQSPDGSGVYGRSNSNTGLAVGVRGISGSTSGIAVHGLATAISGTTYGGLFESYSPNGRGVWGIATRSTGINYGGWFESKSTSGRAIFGFANASSGVNYGVVGHSNSSSGYDFWASGAGSNYGSPSSRRFKSNIVPIGDPLDKIAQLQGVYFDWDEEHGGAHDLGMIAEDVGKVLPEIVNYEENGIDAIGMDYSKMTPLLVEALNALHDEKDSEINSLRAQNAALLARLERLERIVIQQVSD